MTWRSASGDSCEDYEKLMYCDGGSDHGVDWDMFGAGNVQQVTTFPTTHSLPVAYLDERTRKKGVAWANRCCCSCGVLSADEAAA
jgi:hypothetical protein